MVFFIPDANAANRYWVGTATGSDLWESSDNWATSDTGAGGASIPGSSDVAIFMSDGGFPRIRSDFQERTKADFLVGFLLGFTNSEKDKNIINAELFYDMIDLFKKSEGIDDEIVDRATMGIKLTFPITFKTNI